MDNWPIFWYVTFSLSHTAVLAQKSAVHRSYGHSGLLRTVGVACLSRATHVCSTLRAGFLTTRSRASRLTRFSVLRLVSDADAPGGPAAAHGSLPPPCPRGAVCAPPAPCLWARARTATQLRLEMPLPATADATRRCSRPRLSCRRRRRSLTHKPQPLETSLLAFLITTIKVLGHIDSSLTRQACWQKSPPFRFCFLPEKVFLCRFWREPAGAGTCLPLCGEAAFCLWFLPTFSLYF